MSSHNASAEGSDELPVRRPGESLIHWLACRDRRLKASDFQVLNAIGGCVDTQLLAITGFDLLADLTSLDLVTVVRTVKRLEKFGYLVPAGWRLGDPVGVDG